MRLMVVIVIVFADWPWHRFVSCVIVILLVVVYADWRLSIGCQQKLLPEGPFGCQLKWLH